MQPYIIGDRRPVLEDSAPRKPTKGEIDKWIKANIKEKARLIKLEECATEINSILSTLKADNLDTPNLCRLVIAWGIGSQPCSESYCERACSHVGNHQRPGRLMVPASLPGGIL